MQIGELRAPLSSTLNGTYSDSYRNSTKRGLPYFGNGESINHRCIARKEKCLSFM